MNKTKLTFVVLLEYVNLTLEDVYTFGLTLNEDESDLELGYFTVEGDTESIQSFQSFMNGSEFL
jgi:hypothetical protein